MGIKDKKILDYDTFEESNLLKFILKPFDLLKNFLSIFFKNHKIINNLLCFISYILKTLFFIVKKVIWVINLLLIIVGIYSLLGVDAANVPDVFLSNIESLTTNVSNEGYRAQGYTKSSEYDKYFKGNVGMSLNLRRDGSFSWIIDNTKTNRAFLEKYEEYIFRDNPIIEEQYYELKSKYEKGEIILDSIEVRVSINGRYNIRKKGNYLSLDTNTYSPQFRISYTNENNEKKIFDMDLDVEAYDNFSFTYEVFEANSKDGAGYNVKTKTLILSHGSMDNYFLVNMLKDFIGNGHNLDSQNDWSIKFEAHTSDAPQRGNKWTNRFYKLKEIIFG